MKILTRKVLNFCFPRAEAKQWFATKVDELSGMNLKEKAVKQAILTAIKWVSYKHL